MRMMAMALAVGLLTASGASAADRNGYRTITAGDFSQAVARIEAERRIYPQRIDLILNLAAAYRRVGRTAEARTLYQQVIARPVVMMDMPDGTVASSRDLATLGMARLTEKTLAVR